MASNLENGSTATAGAKAPRRLGELWQAPVFVLGVLAVLVVAGIQFTRPARIPQRIDDALRLARLSLEGPKPQFERALELAQDVLDQTVARGNPEPLAEAHFLLGSAHLQRALGVRGDAGQEAWLKALEHLQEAERLVVAEQDIKCLNYHLGWAGFQTDMDPARVVVYLSRGLPEGAKNLFEGYGMLVQAHLRLPIPNVQEALAASKKQLDLPTDSEDVLAPARLLRAQLLLRLDQREEARQVLSCIRRTAPSEVFSQSRRLLAENCEKDELWSEAAVHWQDILSDKETLPADRGMVLYHLGLCQVRVGKEAEAEATLAGALLLNGEAAQAAALKLAELRLTQDKPAKALECFERAVQRVDRPSDYHNSLVDLAEARNIFEKANQAFRLAGDFKSCRRLSELFQKLAPPGVAEGMLGEAAEAWAKECETAQRPQEAKTHFRDAGSAYRTVAAVATSPTDQAKWLWRGVRCALQGQDQAAALAGLVRFLDVEKDPGLLGEGWFLLAQIHQDQNHKGDAKAAYHKCVEYATPFAFKARFQLAQDQIQEGKLDEAEASLKQNLDLMRDKPEEEAFEKTLFSLSGLYYHRADYRLAALRLQEVLDRYPTNPRAVMARLQLAACYRQLANQAGLLLKPGQKLTEDARTHHRDQFRLWLEKAVAANLKLMEDLEPRLKAGTLTPAEMGLLNQAGFALADCRFDLGDYKGALAYYELLAQRYQKRPEQLTALSQMWRCYWALEEVDKARQTVQQVAAALKSLDETMFTDQKDQATRKEWQQWLDWASKQELAKPISPIRGISASGYPP